MQQLAHLGIGHIIAIDPDRVERTNRHRVVGINWLDIWLRRRKVDVMYRLVRHIGTDSRCEHVFARVPDPTTVEALKQADIIVGCVDNLHARLDLQELASRFLIPYVDLGVNIRSISSAHASERRVTVGGNVITYIPGGFCLWCCGFLSEEKLAWERSGPNQSYFQNRPGEAQVVSFNGMVASQAVTEVLQLLTGFAGTGLRQVDLALDHQPGLQRGFRKLDGTSGTLHDWGGKKQASCEHCWTTLANGEVVWVPASKS